MPDLASLLTALDSDALARGTQFERLCRWLLASAPEYRQLLEEVWLWEEWPGRKGGRDTGIDLVARARDGSLWAIQAKAYHRDYYVTKQDIDSFLSASARREFSFRLLLSTTDHFGPNARDVLAIQDKPVHVRGRAWLESLELDWPAHPDDLRPKPPIPKHPRPHQQEAIDATLHGLGDRDRGQLLMACGTGKTLVGLWVAEALRSERTLVLVPSLSLLSQTLAEWCANARGDFQLLAICSDQTVATDDYDAAISRTLDLGIPVTTSPTDIRAFLTAPGRRVVFSTYQSSPEIAKAMRPHPEGEVLAFDLAICDEAHRCAVRPSSDFATILDESKIRARRRLFMTATPKIFLGRARGKDEEFEVCSMDNEETFGPVVHRLSFGEAIARDLLSDYQVAIVVIDDEEMRAMAERGRFVEVEGTMVADARTLAQELAVAKLMRDPTYQLRRLVTFHSRVKAALGFAVSLPQTLGMLSDAERPAGTVWAQHISGEMPTSERAMILERLRRLGPGERGVVSNARCLTEGVDLPSLDGVAFLDPVRSKVDIVQAVGRAIRRAEDKTTGTVLVPVYLSSTADPETALEASAFAAVWDVLRALRAHDDVLASDLDQMRQALGALSSGVRRGIEDLPEAEPVEEAALERGRVARFARVQLPSKIRIVLPERLNLSEFARALRIRVVERSTSSFEYCIGELTAYAAGAGHTRVPHAFVTVTGFPLGTWVTSRRREFGGGKLSAERVSALAKLPGWTWDPDEDDFARGFEELCAYATREGHARVPVRYATPDGFGLGIWVANRRVSHGKGELSAERVAAFEGVSGWTWDPFEEDFQYGLSELRAYAAQEGHSRVAQKHRTPGGFALGAWVNARREAYGSGRLATERVTALEQLPGWTWDPLDDEFQRGLAELRAFAAREGHARVTRGHRTAGGYWLGTWAASRRQEQRKGTLQPSRRALLEAVPGWTWDLEEHDFRHGLDELTAFVDREGHARVPAKLTTRSGFRLGGWIHTRRNMHRSGKLSQRQVAALEAVPGWTWAPIQDDFLQALIQLRDFVEREGHTRVPLVHTTASGFRLGRWANMCRSKQGRGALPTHRVAALEGVQGWIWDVVEAEFEDGLVELRTFVKREGHARVPSKHKTLNGFQLGTWVSSRRGDWRRGTLGPARVAALEELPGWTWEAREHNFLRGLDALRAYAAREGHARVPQKYVSQGGFHLGSWVANLRTQGRTRLSDERVLSLEAIPGWTWRPRPSGD